MQITRIYYFVFYISTHIQLIVQTSLVYMKRMLHNYYTDLNTQILSMNNIFYFQITIFRYEIRNINVNVQMRNKYNDCLSQSLESKIYITLKNFTSKNA